MIDRARKYTDRELRRLERRLKRKYRAAGKEAKTIWAGYMIAVRQKIEPEQKARDNAVKAGVRADIAAAEKALEDAKMSNTILSPAYKKMTARLTGKLATVNQAALVMVNARLLDVYIVNHNVIADTVKKLGVDFTLVNKNTVKNLKTRSLNITKDKAWNTRQINSSLLQGIKRGESMDKIAERILPIVNNNEASSVRAARTMVTQVENKGRLDSYKELEEDGTVMEKRWIATQDDRTRESHLLMDGETVGIDEEFSNGLMYPGDPDGDDDSEIYNCRCSMEAVVVGFKDKDGKVHKV